MKLYKNWFYTRDFVLFNPSFHCEIKLSVLPSYIRLDAYPVKQTRNRVKPLLRPPGDSHRPTSLDNVNQSINH